MINQENLKIFFIDLFVKAKEHYDEFNSLDGQLGDGDLGITIFKGLEEINSNLDKFGEDIGKNFLISAQSFTKASSSSFGTLVAISFMAIAKELKDKNEIPMEDVPSLLNKAIFAVCDRGKSNIGDKTFVDSLNEIANSLKNKNENFPKNILQASEEALKKFKGKECKIGRARMFSEKSKNLDDPGMFAIYKLCSVFEKM